METLILIAILAVGASALYVAATFSRRTSQSLAPLERSVTSSRKEILGRQEGTDKAISSIRADIGSIRNSLEQRIIESRSDSLRFELERINDQLNQLNSSTARQDEVISALEGQGEEHKMEEGKSAETGLETAMLEAEAFVAQEGWSRPPEIFALATKTAFLAADPELADQLKDVEPDALVPLQQDNEELSGDKPLDALARVHWPDEVLGCVLVTEIVIVPPEAENDAPDDSAAVEQWAATQSDARVARLAVAVTRTGGYICGLRLKGEDGVRVAPDLADDVVAALLATFLSAGGDSNPVPHS